MISPVEYIFRGQNSFSNYCYCGLHNYKTSA